MNAVEGRCYGNDREDDETMPPGQDENAEGISAVSAAVDAKVVLAMAISRVCCSLWLIECWPRSTVLI